MSSIISILHSYHLIREDVSHKISYLYFSIQKPTYEQKQPVYTYIGMFLVTALLGYIAVYLFVQQDINNTMGLPDYVLDHFVKVSELVEMGKVVVETHIYDSRKFEL